MPVTIVHTGSSPDQPFVEEREALDARFFGQMKRSAYFINTSRGAVVVQRGGLPQFVANPEVLERRRR